VVLEARIRFVVDAEPRSQGSMTAVYNRKLGVSRVRHANAPALESWRSMVRAAAINAGAEAWVGPIGMHMSFGIKPPVDHRHGYPKAPDLDKLVRGVLDALTTVCYGDDSQVCTIQSEKVFHTATVIEVWRIERQHPTQTDAQATLWTEDAQGMEPYPQTGYRKR
jgi:Holliday junction resolvase RusA-like endonuclease